jgi:hypothetical protein
VQQKWSKSGAKKWSKVEHRICFLDPAVLVQFIGARAQAHKSATKRLNDVFGTCIVH